MTTGPVESQSAEPTQQDEHPSNTFSSNLSVWTVAGIATFCAVVVVILALIVYTRFFETHVTFATVDLQHIMEARQLQFISKVTGPNVTDRERGEAYDLASRFGHDLNEALKTAQKECGCIILTQSAVVLGNQPDMTSRIKELMGLQGVNVDALKQQFKQGFDKKPDQEAPK